MKTLRRTEITIENSIPSFTRFRPPHEDGVVSLDPEQNILIRFRPQRFRPTPLEAIDLATLFGEENPRGSIVS